MNEEVVFTVLIFTEFLHYLCLRTFVYSLIAIHQFVYGT